MSTQEEPQVPDPNGPPVLSYCQEKFPWTKTRVGMTTTFIVAASGIVGFLVLASVATPTMGASRSHRIKWQQRQAEIDQAQANSEAHQDSLAADQTHD